MCIALIVANRNHHKTCNLRRGRARCGSGFRELPRISSGGIPYLPSYNRSILWIRSREQGCEGGEHVSESTSVRDKREGKRTDLQSGYNLRIYNPSACRSYNGRATAARVTTIRHESEVTFPVETS